MSRRPLIIMLLAALAGATGLFVFWPCTQNNFLQWDDIPAYLGHIAKLGGLSLRSLRWAFTQSATIGGYYHPLTWISLLLDYSLWGRQPFPYHATNVLLHVFNTILLVVYLERLLRSGLVFSECERCVIALVVGIVFAIHPLQVESVAWIAERKTLLCATFVLASLYAHVKMAERPSSCAWSLAMNGWFLLALLSKPMAIPLPLILLVLDWYPLRRHLAISWWRLLREKLPMIVLSVLAAGATFFTQSHQGAISTSVGPFEGIWMVPRNLVFYLWKLIWPGWLSPFYPTSQNVSLSNAEYWVPLGLCVVLVVVALLYRRRLPALGSALCCYVLLLAPTSGVVPLGGYAVADRYAYLAIVPVLVFAAGAVRFLWRHWGRTLRIVLTILIAGQILFYARTSRAQMSVWRDDQSLWSAVLSHYPNSAMANCQMAAALIDRGRFEQAYAFARRAVELSPGFPQALATAGLIDLKLRRYADAAKELSQAIEEKPGLLTARYNLACADARLGRLSDAYAGLEELIAVHPEYAALAARDRELEALRKDPVYAPRLAALLDAAKN